ncbi:MAG: GyrI-like domain-containing protein [Bacteroidetes bacterium]|nr:GyrI-like domain-containing protein [Bacteroidota bacterium]
MQARIEHCKEKKLVGKRLFMSLADNQTAELWKGFMSLRNEIANKLTNDFISMAVYQPTYFTAFNPSNEFEKWATVEVTDFDNLPNGMETFTLTAGLYAVFDYKGSSTESSIFQYIFGTWLPDSDYLLDDRPHFEVLGAKYKNADPNSEEEIWIPIRKKYPFSDSKLQNIVCNTKHLTL